MIKDIIKRVDTFLTGKKSYAISVLTIIGAICLVYSGNIDKTEALQLITGSLGLYSLRDAISKK